MGTSRRGTQAPPEYRSLQLCHQNFVFNLTFKSVDFGAFRQIGYQELEPDDTLRARGHPRIFHQCTDLAGDHGAKWVDSNTPNPLPWPCPYISFWLSTPWSQGCKHGLKVGGPRHRNDGRLSKIQTAVYSTFSLLIRGNNQIVVKLRQQHKNGRPHVRWDTYNHHCFHYFAHFKCNAILFVSRNWHHPKNNLTLL